MKRSSPARAWYVLKTHQHCALYSISRFAFAFLQVLSVNRVKNIIKNDVEVKSISTEACFAIAKATVRSFNTISPISWALEKKPPLENHRLIFHLVAPFICTLLPTRVRQFFIVIVSNRGNGLKQESCFLHVSSSHPLGVSIFIFSSSQSGFIRLLIALSTLHIDATKQRSNWKLTWVLFF